MQSLVHLLRTEDLDMFSITALKVSIAEMAGLRMSLLRWSLFSLSPSKEEMISEQVVILCWSLNCD